MSLAGIAAGSVANLFVLTVAAAFSAASGFSATTAASTLAVDGAGRGAAGLAFDGATLYVVDPFDGNLYRAVAGVTTRVGNVGNLPTGLALGLDGRLYATRRGPAAPDVVELNKLTGAVLRTVATSADLVAAGSATPCPNALATDPASGDLFLTACDFVWRIAMPAASTPRVSFYASLLLSGSPKTTYAIAIAPDDSIFVTSGDELWRVQGPAQVGPDGTPSKEVVGSVGGARGLAVVTNGTDSVPRYLYVNASDGTITKVPIPGGASGSALVALSGGEPGDLATLGPDRCAYASQGGAVLRLAKADGTCDLFGAAPPLPQPSLTLARTSSVEPRLGDGEQTFGATLANVPSLGGVPIVFTVAGANPLTMTVVTAPNGVASFGYLGTSTGIDLVTASATLGGSTLTSNAVTVVWLRAFDLAAPTITYVVTAASRGGNFACPNPALSQLGQVEYCGWYTSPPTVTFTATPNGPSGLGALGPGCAPFTLVADSPLTGTPVTCIALNGDGVSRSLKVVLQALISAPTISASATTADGHVYLAGTPTDQAVTVTFTCASDPALGPGAVTACTPPQTVARSTAAVTGAVTDVAGTTRTATFGPIVITTQASRLRIVSSPTLAAGAAHVSASLVASDGSTPVVGRTVTFSAGGLTASGVTGASGVATVTLALAPGLYTLRATFGGDAAFFGSRATQAITVFQPTTFVVWGGTGSDLGVGSRVEFWGADWAKQIPETLRRRVDAFKGFAASASGSTWTARPGDGKPPKSVARYIGVIVTTSVKKDGDTISGNMAALLILRVEDDKKAFDSKLGDKAFGTVVAFVH